MDLPSVMPDTSMPMLLRKAFFPARNVLMRQSTTQLPRVSAVEVSTTHLGDCRLMKSLELRRSTPKFLMRHAALSFLAIVLHCRLYVATIYAARVLHDETLHSVFSLMVYDIQLCENWHRRFDQEIMRSAQVDFAMTVYAQSKYSQRGFTNGTYLTAYPLLAKWFLSTSLLH